MTAAETLDMRRARTEPSPVPIPYDEEAESALLGAMLLSNDCARTGKTMLLAVDFYLPRHRAAFDAMVGMFEDGVIIDPVTLAATLDQAGPAADAARPSTGWRRWCAQTQAETPSSANATGYADVIIERADRRRLAGLGERLVNTALDLAIEPDEIVAATRSGLDAVQRAGGVRKHLSFAEWSLSVDMSETWLVPDILERRDRVLLVAPEGYGKSHLLRQWALMCAAGIHWFTERPMVRRSVLIVDVENSDRQIVRNTTAMYRFAEQVAPGFDGDRFVIAPYSCLDLTQRSDRLSVESLIAGHRPDLLVIGPLYKILPPPSAKLSYEEAAMAGTHVIDDWRARYDVAVLIEHHAPKGAGGRRDFDPLGSSAWMRWPEYGLALAPDPDNARVSKLGHFRGQRERRPWPEALERGGLGQWPWRSTPDYRVQDSAF